MIKHIHRTWEQFEYKHTAITLIVIFLLVILFDSALIAAVFEWLRNLHYIAAFLAGMFSVSFFTAAPALVLLVEVATELNPWLVIFCASIGSVLGDWIILRFMEDQVIHELKPLLRKFHIPGLLGAMQRNHGRWLVMTLGAIAISTPLPDEIGIGLLNISHLERWRILVICFVLNTIGIAVLVFLGRAIW